MTLNSFDQKYEMVKKYHTDTLMQAIATEKVDEVLIPFLLEVSKIKDVFTSSSCAGRIMLLSTNELEDKKVSSFHKRYHRKVSVKEIKEDIENFSEEELWFKMEPFIFHFGCKDYEKAKELLSFAQEFGLKKAGIIAANEGKYILEVTSTENMALPVKQGGALLISEKYLEFIIDRANKKIEKNFERLERFSSSFLKSFS